MARRRRVCCYIDERNWRTVSRLQKVIQIFKFDEKFAYELLNGYFSSKFAYCIRYLPRERETTHHQSESLDECDDENYSRCSSIVSTSTTDENVSVGVLPEIIVIISPIQAPCFYLSLAREAVFYAQRNVNELLPRFFSAVFWKPFPRTTGTFCQ